jgi:hypothetical protein
VFKKLISQAARGDYGAPRELEYRFVHRDLVLWDVRADLIVDVLRDAIPVESDQRTTRRRRDS